MNIFLRNLHQDSSTGDCGAMRSPPAAGSTFQDFLYLVRVHTRKEYPFLGGCGSREDLDLLLRQGKERREEPDDRCIGLPFHGRRTHQAADALPPWIVSGRKPLGL